MWNNEPTLRPLSPSIGVEMEGMDLSHPSAGGRFAEVRNALDAYALVLVRNQRLNLHGFGSVARQFGSQYRFRLMQPRPGKHAEHYSCPGEPDVTLLGNVKLPGMPDAMSSGNVVNWHFDDVYKPCPNRYTVLYAIETPEAGGDTVFAGMCAAYDALDADTKAQIDNLEGVYSIERIHAFFQRADPSRRPLTDETIEANPPAHHPLARMHPQTGRKGLFVAPEVMSHIEGLTEEASMALAQTLYEHAVSREFSYRHEWRNRDLVIWDNHFAMHTATPFDAERERRLLYRTMVANQVA